MAKTLRELFKGSPQDKSVKADKETFIEQETSGIRIKSLVELNNPLIYGNEAVRIVQRSTPLLEDMKSNTGGSESGGGLIGGKINQARDFVNSKLGIPEAQIPSRVVDKINEKSAKKEITSSDPIDTDIVGANGTGLGKFLKDSGGGNPKTLGKQALGNGIGLVKDKIRGKLFGEPQTIGEVAGEPTQLDYNNTNPYTKVLTDNRDYKKEGGTAKEFTGIDLTLVSPIHGTKRKDTDGRFGKSEYAYEDIRYSYRQPTPYDSTRTYTRNEDSQLNGIVANSLDVKYGMTNGSDSINLLGSGDYDKLDDYGRALNETGEIIGEDLVPFNIGKYGSKKTPFRSIISGISETVTPGWSSNKMLGNPFSFYTYTGVERSVTFVLKIVCYSPLELATNWEKMETLTKMAYPSITKSNLVNPPIIEFRLGDMYYNKVGFIESLTNTIPDNSTWETDGNLGYLPKFIDCSITIKFIEDTSVLNSLYGYKKSKAAIDKINETNQSEGFKSDSLLSDRAGNNDASLFSRFNIDKPEPIKVNARGITPVGNSNIPKVNMGGLAKMGNGGSVITPQATEEGVSPSIKTQSAISDKLDGKTPAEKIKELESKQNLTPAQSSVVAGLVIQGYKNYTGPKLGEYRERNNDNGMVMYYRRDFFDDQVVRVFSSGNVTGPYPTMTGTEII